MEEPRRRDVDILGWRVGGGGVRIELCSDVVPRDRRPSHLSIHVGDGWRRSEEIVKKSRIAPLNAIIIIMIIE